MLPDPAGRFGACLGNRSVFVLDPRLEVAVNLLHFKPPPPPPPAPEVRCFLQVELL